MAGRKKKNKITWLLFVPLIIVITVAAGVYFWLSAPQNPFIEVYFFKGEKPFAVKRILKADAAPLQRALGELLSGPTKTEEKQGINTLIPPGTKILTLSVKDKVAVINFNRKLEAGGGGAAWLRGMVAQIVYTATAIPGVDKVWIWVEGEKEVVLGGEGLVLDHPLSRREVSY